MPNHSFPRELRLLTSEEYNKVFKKPVRFRAKGMVVLACKNDADCPRLGLVIPKKILKRAVWRCRIKRQVRESFRLSQDSLPHVDLVFLARPGIGDISNREISSTLSGLWAQISRQLGKQRS